MPMYGVGGGAYAYAQLGKFKLSAKSRIEGVHHG